MISTRTPGAAECLIDSGCDGAGNLQRKCEYASPPPKKKMIHFHRKRMAFDKWSSDPQACDGAPLRTMTLSGAPNPAGHYRGQ